MNYKIILLMVSLFVLTTASVIVYAGGSQETGLDVKLMQVYGFDLIDYEVSSKYQDHTTDNKFVVLEINAYDENMVIHNMNWVMKYDKYQDLKEKV